MSKCTAGDQVFVNAKTMRVTSLSCKDRHGRDTAVRVDAVKGSYNLSQGFANPARANGWAIVDFVERVSDARYIIAKLHDLGRGHIMQRECKFSRSDMCRV